MAQRFNVDRDLDRALLVRPSVTEDGLPEALPRSWEYGSRQAMQAGFRMTAEYPDMLPDKKDWKEIIADCHAKQIFPMYHRRASNLPQKPSQNGLGHCWNYGATHTMEDRILVQFGKCKKLAPNSLAWLVNWRNQGYYLNETVVGVQERGISLAEYCPEYKLNPDRDFKPGWERIALNCRLAPDGVWDTTRQNGVDQFIAQCLAILRTASGLYSAHNWWGHALEVTGMLWDESVVNNIVWVHFNSHADGEIEMTGQKAIPDEAYGFGSVMLPAE